MIPLCPSTRCLTAAAIFGVPIEAPADRSIRGSARSTAPRLLHARARAAAAELDAALAPGSVALVTGPSGAGKSLLLAALRDRLGSRAIAARPPGPARAGRALVDLDPAPLPEWLACLARSGLAEAALLTIPYACLSEGQRRRADLALALARLQRRASVAAEPRSPREPAPTLVADEFASTLDRLTARSLACVLRRWVRPLPGARAARVPALRAVVATAHDDLIEALRPDVLVVVPLDAPPEVHAR